MRVYYVVLQVVECFMVWVCIVFPMWHKFMYVSSSSTTRAARAGLALGVCLL